ncbi:hypothetical protein [Falsigemmobacter intermedius]
MAAASYGTGTGAAGTTLPPPAQHNTRRSLASRVS